MMKYTIKDKSDISEGFKTKIKQLRENDRINSLFEDVNDLTVKATKKEIVARELRKDAEIKSKEILKYIVENKSEEKGLLLNLTSKAFVNKNRLNSLEDNCISRSEELKYIRDSYEEIGVYNKREHDFASLDYYDVSIDENTCMLLQQMDEYILSVDREIVNHYSKVPTQMLINKSVSLRVSRTLIQSSRMGSVDVNTLNVLDKLRVDFPNLIREDLEKTEQAINDYIRENLEEIYLAN